MHNSPYPDGQLVGSAWRSRQAGVVAALADHKPMREALRSGAACGALNVVRHGLGTGGARAVETLAERVELWACRADGRP